MARRQLSAPEMDQVIREKPFCFICGIPIAVEDRRSLQFDHIKARSLEVSDPDRLENYAAVHRQCHQGKGTKSLEEYKEELRLEKEFGSIAWFTDVARRLNPTRDKPVYEIDRDKMEIRFGDGTKADLCQCPNTGLYYFYHSMKRQYLESDVEVQPRGLETKRLRNLALNLRTNFQLSPSVCRLITAEGKVKVFDGQHKATAQALGNLNETIDCKVFIDPPLDMVRRVVIEAHGSLRQQEFKTSELFKKLASNYKEIVEKWELDHPGLVISERDLPSALGLSKDEVSKLIIAWTVEAVIEHPNCDLSLFVSRDRRPGDRPITYDMLSWSVSQLIKRPPVAEPMDAPENLRELERENIVNFLNLISEQSLADRWTPNIPDNAGYQKAKRFYYRASFREWLKLLDVALRMFLYLTPNDPIFYRTIESDKWQKIHNACRKLFEHALWVDPNPEVGSILNSNVQKNVASLFERNRLNLEYLCTP